MTAGSPIKTHRCRDCGKLRISAAGRLPKGWSPACVDGVDGARCAGCRGKRRRDVVPYAPPHRRIGLG